MALTFDNYFCTLRKKIGYNLKSNGPTLIIVLHDNVSYLVQ